MFPLFVSVSIILEFKEKIVSCRDKIIPQILSSIYLDDFSELEKIISVARSLKENLPYSILMKITKYGVFNLDDIDNLNNLLEKEACLSLLPCEVVHRTYPEVDICPCKDANCP